MLATCSAAHGRLLRSKLAFRSRVLAGPTQCRDDEILEHMAELIGRENGALIRITAWMPVGTSKVVVTTGVS